MNQVQGNQTFGDGQRADVAIEGSLQSYRQLQELKSSIDQIEEGELNNTEEFPQTSHDDSIEQRRLKTSVRECPDTPNLYHVASKKNSMNESSNQLSINEQQQIKQNFETLLYYDNTQIKETVEQEESKEIDPKYTQSRQSDYADEESSAIKVEKQCSFSLDSLSDDSSHKQKREDRNDSNTNNSMQNCSQSDFSLTNAPSIGPARKVSNVKSAFEAAENTVKTKQSSSDKISLIDTLLMRSDNYIAKEQKQCIKKEKVVMEEEGPFEQDQGVFSSIASGLMQNMRIEEESKRSSATFGDKQSHNDYKTYMESAQGSDPATDPYQIVQQQEVLEFDIRELIQNMPSSSTSDELTRNQGNGKQNTPSNQQVKPGFDSNRHLSTVEEENTSLSSEFLSAQKLQQFTSNQTFHSSASKQSVKNSSSILIQSQQQNNSQRNYLSTSPLATAIADFSTRLTVDPLETKDKENKLLETER